MLIDTEAMGLIQAFLCSGLSETLLALLLCAAARPSASSYYMYIAFNLGFNTIVFLVTTAIILLIAGAFLWLVVAYAANVSIKFGVR